MRKIITTNKISCDLCHKEITLKIEFEQVHVDALPSTRDICKSCFEKLEEPMRKILHGEVRDRRGGWRRLGDYDG